LRGGRMDRTRTFSWRDPAPTAAAGRAQSGIEFLNSPGADRMAPVAECLDFRLAQAERGRGGFELTPSGFQYNPIGTVHGGVLCTLLDSAAGAAVHSMLELGSAYTTLEIKVNFLKPVTVGTGPLSCEGKVVSFGSRVAVSEARVTDAAGKVY